VHESTLAKRYANALAELAIEQDLLEKVGKDLNQFLELFQASQELRFLLTSPTAESHDQHAVMAVYLEKSKPVAVTSKFLRLLIDKRRMVLLEAIVAAFNEKMDQVAGRMAVKVQVLLPLADTQTKQMESVLSAITGKSVRLEVDTDPGILGGMVVTMGSIMVDYSVRNHLNRLKASMRG
jgi:F-type H+-transporting ATPase subunit delta